jgi:hypothetical protein
MTRQGDGSRVARLLVFLLASLGAIHLSACEKKPAYWVSVRDAATGEWVPEGTEVEARTVRVFWFRDYVRTTVGPAGEFRRPLWADHWGVILRSPAGADEQPRRMASFMLSTYPEYLPEQRNPDLDVRGREWLISLRPWEEPGAE